MSAPLASERRERERVERALEYIRKGLQLDVHFTFAKTNDGAFMGIDRGNHDDSRAFHVTFDPDVLFDQSSGQIRCHSFHELLHAMTQPLYNIVDEILLQVPVSRRRALRKRYWRDREDVIRHMERRLGPRCFPKLPWKKA